MLELIRIAVLALFGEIAGVFAALLLVSTGHQADKYGTGPSSRFGTYRPK